MEDKIPVISSFQLYMLIFLSRVMSLLSVRRRPTFLNLFILFTLSLLLCFIIQRVRAYKRASLYPFAVLLCVFELWRFYCFVRLDKQNKLSALLIMIMLVTAVVYASLLGVEALARFSLLCFFVVMLTAFAVIAWNIPILEPENFLSTDFNLNLNEEFYSDIVLCLDAPVICLLLKQNVKPYSARGITLTVVFSYLLCAVIYAVCFGVTGGAVEYYDYCVQKLFQLGSAGRFTRLDALFIAVWLIVLYLKCSVLLCNLRKGKINEKCD